MFGTESAPPMRAEDVFHFDETRPDFNALSRKNGFVCWYARDPMRLLGCQDWRSFNHTGDQWAQSPTIWNARDE
uniref:Uncharacterized protein n=1 Tax=Candidatus Kentrum sp. LFY TaxID=2126342 RepID=A0A450WEL8_9GAMM|nr:MAG: hypothetical protein BECKLFY1418C_GA0070996_10168 [Candidatus Kentron sp. LFY]